MAIRTPDSVTSSATPAFGRSRIEEQDSTWVFDLFSDFFRGPIRDIFQAHGRHLGPQCPSDCGGAPVTSRWNFDVERYFERTRAFVTFSRKLMLAMDRSISEIEDQDCDIFELARLTLRVGNHALSVVEHGPGGLRSGGLNAGFSLAGHAVGRVEANGASGRTWAARGHEWTLSAGGT